MINLKKQYEVAKDKAIDLIDEACTFVRLHCDHDEVKKSDKILADQESLKIILRNLLDNAIKFSEPNGLIKVYTQSLDENYLNLEGSTVSNATTGPMILMYQKNNVSFPPVSTIGTSFSDIISEHIPISGVWNIGNIKKLLPLKRERN